MGNKVVLKIGSSSLTAHGGGLDNARLTAFAHAAATAIGRGSQITIVSSGAVAAGFRGLGYATRPGTVVGKQAAAAVGQGKLIAAWSAAFAPHGFEVAQVLLTRHDFMHRDSYRNALATLEELHRARCIPIINENDTVAVDELTFGDNDMLAVLVGGLIQADWICIATDIDGLYDQDPRGNPAAKRLKNVSEITPEIAAMAGGAGSSVGTGGMAAKIRAARVALEMGLKVFIGRPEGTDMIAPILAGDGAGTYFGADRGGALSRKRQWIAFHAETAGVIRIDEGAVRALCGGGKSLLPAGIKSSSGSFRAGEVVRVEKLDGEVLGRGVVNYSSDQLAQCQGKSTEEARRMLQHDRVEVIHRDQWIETHGRYL